ncbi:hypothetical protein P8452_18076 [Trifolium repens]|nr:hypothetical protein P8452_18076 [Trifolium repens]
MASSSSTRILRGRFNKMETKTFQTCINPHEPRIQICLKFKAAWIGELEKDFLDGYRLKMDDSSTLLSSFLTPIAT